MQRATTRSCAATCARGRGSPRVARWPPRARARCSTSPTASPRTPALWPRRPGGAPSAAPPSAAPRLPEGGGARLVLDAHAVPVAAGVREVASALGADPVELAVSGGEDYELCACVPPRRRAEAEAAGLTWIGEVEEGPADVTWRGAAPGSERWRGWEHGRA